MLLVLSVFLPLVAAQTFQIPSSAPISAVSVDNALLSVSIEFFAFPAYVQQLSNTASCLSTIQNLRGASPAVRIGGTTQDRATFNASEPLPVRYTVASPSDAPTALTYGPSFFALANQLPGDVTVGLNRQLNNENNTMTAAKLASSAVSNLISIELGNEPEFYNSSSPIIPPGQTWSPTTDAASQNKWHQDLRATLGKPMGQAAVYLQSPTWSTSELVPKIPDALSSIVSFSGHSYPQSACGGASTDLQSLQSHSGIVSYTSQYKVEAATAHNVSKHYYLAETNSATCGGGGISSTFGAALWIVDYATQAALIGVERLYFHQGTIGNCAYCWWGTNAVFAPYYGVAFLSEFLSSTPGVQISMLDSGTSSIAAYAAYVTGEPRRILLLNTAYYNGTGTRGSVSITLTNLPRASGVTARRLTAPAATTTDVTAVTLGGQSFDSMCGVTGKAVSESVVVTKRAAVLTLKSSEGLIVLL